MNEKIDYIIHQILEEYGVFTDKNVKELPIHISFLIGPYMVVSGKYEESLHKLIVYGDEFIAFLYKSYQIQNQTQGTCGDLKKNLKEISASLTTDGEFAYAIRRKCNELIGAIREHQFMTKSLENALINIAPIVPYDGMIVKQWIDDNPSGEVELYKDDIVHTTNFIRKVSEKDLIVLTHDLIINHVHAILDKAIEYTCLNKTEYDKLLKIDNTNPLDFEIKLYYLCAHFLFDYHSHSSIEVRDKLLQYLKAVKSIEVKEVSMDSMVDILGITPEYDTAEEFWNEMGMDDKTYNQIEDLVNSLDNIDNKNEPASKFDIQLMISYIHNHKEYICDEYTNLEFINRTKGQQVENISYYSDNMMTALINKKYVVMPFLDLANDYKLCNLCMDETGEIFIKYDYEFD